MMDDVRSVRNWYRWLWFSPLLTVPSQFILSGVFAGALSNNHNRSLSEINGLALALAITAAGLWHLVLLFPALGGKAEFVRWHGRQALLIGGIRTLAPLAFAALSFGSLGYILQMVLWMVSTVMGQQQAKRGECALMRWSGHGAGLPLPVDPVAPASPDDGPALVEIIRRSPNPERRRIALGQLEKLGWVDSL